MNNKEKMVNVRFGAKEYEELKKLADDLGIKVSEAVRRSVLIASGKLG